MTNAKLRAVRFWLPGYSVANLSCPWTLPLNYNVRIELNKYKPWTTNISGVKAIRLNQCCNRGDYTLQYYLKLAEVVLNFNAFIRAVSRTINHIIFLSRKRTLGIDII